MTPPQPPFALTSPIETPVYDTCIVDGSYLIHRILYASGSKGEPPFSEMMTSMGVPTGAIYGCLKTLRANINLADFIAKDLVIIWDGRPRGLSPRRVAMYPGYKVHERVNVEDIADPVKAEQVAKEQAASDRHRELLEEQRPKLNNVLWYLGVPTINLPYREGDDIVACATRLLPGRLLIMSDDRDYYQLVSDRVHVYRAGVKDPHLVHPGNFEQKVGVKSPSHYLLSAAISGDGSDAIDGIPGVGDTTAQRVANNTDLQGGWASYPAIKKSAEALMESDKRNRKRYDTLIKGLEVVTRNLQLMDLRLEGMSEQEVEAFWQAFRQPREVNEQEVIRWFHHFEFKSYLEDFSGWVHPFRKLSMCESTAA